MNEISIEFDFNQALTQAKRLEEIAQELKTLSKSEVDSALADLRSGWRGETSLLYIVKGEALSGKILKVSDDLQKAAASIRKIANRIYDAEMAVLEIASARNY